MFIVFDPTTIVSSTTIATNGAISSKKLKKPISVFSAIMVFIQLNLYIIISGQRETVGFKLFFLILTKFFD